jgi:hypothetical protein
VSALPVPTSLLARLSPSMVAASAAPASATMNRAVAASGNRVRLVPGAPLEQRKPSGEASPVLFRLSSGEDSSLPHAPGAARGAVFGRGRVVLRDPRDPASFEGPYQREDSRTPSERSSGTSRNIGCLVDGAAPGAAYDGLPGSSRKEEALRDGPRRASEATG